MKNSLLISVLGCGLAVVLLAACGHAPDSREADAGGAGASIFHGFMWMYEGPLNHLSAVRRGSCPMYPSCSEYSRQAVAVHGAAVGWTLAMDRLLRCGRNETRLVPTIFIEGQWKFYDPLEANDSWWSARESDAERNR